MTTAQILGLITGILFGFLLQKARVVRFEKQVGAMLLKDMTILKFMLTAICVGMVGIQALKQYGVITFSHKPMNVGAVVMGGLIFGIGWPLGGFCPGTAVGALAEGRWHALFVILGMLAGVMIFAACYPWLAQTVLAWKDFGKIGLAESLGVPPAVLVAVFWIICGALFVLFEKKGL